MTNKTEAKDQTDSAPVMEASPGEQLRRARKEKGLGIDDLVPQLGLPARVLNAIETDDYERLPAPMYVRGYVRRYCASLELPEEQVLQAVEQQLAARGIKDHSPSLKLPVAPKKKFKFRLSFLVVPLILILLVVAAVFVWAMQTDETINITAVEKSAVTIQPQLEMKQLPNLSSNNVQSYEELNPTVRAVAEEGGDDGIRNLYIRVVQQSWVEVFDAEGGMLVADLKSSGTELDVNGLAPFTVILGYAPGIEIMYAGEPITVATIANDNTATLKIGDELTSE